MDVSHRELFPPLALNPLLGLCAWLDAVVVAFPVTSLLVDPASLLVDPVLPLSDQQRPPAMIAVVPISFPH